MRFLWVVMLFPLLAAPQTGALVSGVLLERDTQAPSGQFSVRAADNQVYRYLFDADTYVDRGDASIDVARLQPGEKIEVFSDRMPHAEMRYALTIHVVASPPPRAAAALRYGASARAEDRPLPAGTLSFSGVVSRLSDARVVLRLRNGVDQPIILLKNTRYMDGGEIVDAAALKPSMRVFVQAGKSIYNEVEAYQVVWGQILQPK